MTGLLRQDWFAWGIGLILGFQILVVVLGELLYRADRRTLPIAPILRAVRNAVLPLLVVYIFVLKILEAPADTIAVRAIATAFWITVLYAGLLLVNVLIFEQAPEGSWRQRAPSLFQDLLRMLLVAIGASIVLAVVWGQNLGGLIAALGVGSIVLGLALQETLGNLMAGIALLFERPFSIGDWIEVGGEKGAVVQINWRSVHLRTRERNLLVFPNAVLGREPIINYARPSPLQTLRLSFMFSLQDPPNKVKRMLCGVAEELDAVLTSPPPRALMREVLEDRIRYEAVLPIDQPRRIPQIVDAFTTRVWYAAQREGITLPLPTAYEIKVDAPASAAAAIDVASCLAAAQGLEALDPADIARLASAARIHMFADGEMVIDEDDLATAVYVLQSGALRVTCYAQGAVFAELELEPGEVIGVTTLARQETSQTRVRAAGDATLILLPHAVVDALLQDNASLAYEFARINETRLEALRRAHGMDIEERPADDDLLPGGMRRPQDTPDDDNENES